MNKKAASVVAARALVRDFSDFGIEDLVDQDHEGWCVVCDTVQHESNVERLPKPERDRLRKAFRETLTPEQGEMFAKLSEDAAWQEAVERQAAFLLGFQYFGVRSGQ